MGARERASTAAPRDRARIVGRAAEVQLVRRLVDEREPSVLVLEGEAGIGKTTLLDVAAHRAGRGGAVVLRATAEEWYGARPLALLAEALGRPPDSPHDTSALLAEAADRWRPTADGTDRFDGGGGGVAVDAVPPLVDRALDVLEVLTLDRPALVVLDDLQWADPASLLVLAPLIGRAVPLGVAFVLAMRPVPRPATVDALVDRIAADGAVRRRIEPLTDSDVLLLTRLLVDGEAPDELVQVTRKAGGNPFLVRELVRVGADGGATDIVEVVARRLRHTDDRVTELLRSGAVLGSLARPDDLAAILDRPLGEVVEGLTQATRAGLLAARESNLSFQHDLVREALVHQTPEPVQRALHRRAAAVLRERGAAPEVVVGHLVAGVEHGDRTVIAALRDVARGGAPVVTADLLVTALDRCAPDDPQRPELAAEAADALVYAGRPSDAVAVAEAALADDPPAGVAYQLRACRSHALFTSGDPATAVRAWTESQRTGTAAAGPVAVEAAEVAEVALARLFSGDTAGARRDAQAALGAGDDASPLTRSTAHAVLAWLEASAADLPAAMVHAEASEAVWRSAPDRPRGGSPYGAEVMRAAVADAAGRDDLVATALDAAWRQVRDQGMAVLEPMVYAVAAVHHLRRGEWDDALAATDAGVAAMADSGVRLAANWLAAVRALVLLDRDDHDGAAAALDRIAEPGVLLGQDWVALARSRHLDATGDPTAARELLGTLVELLVTVGARSCLAYAGPDLARLVVAGDDARRRSWLRDAVAALPSELPAPLAGAVASITATLDANGQAVLAAGLALEACGRRAEAARTIAWAATLLTDDPEAARNAARRASALFDEMGAIGPAGALRSSLRDAGIRFRAPTTTRATVGWDALTATERRVVALVADGLTNAAIAERLTVSRRTVESHLVRAYRKVDVRSRVELARLAADQPTA